MFTNKYKRFRSVKRQASVFLTIFLVLIYFIYIIIFFGTNKTEILINENTIFLNNCSCLKKHGECYFDTVICDAGYDGNCCEKPITDYKKKFRYCLKNISMDEWTYDLVEKIKEECSKSRFIHEWPSSCVFLCFYHRRTGVVRVPKLFWTNSLRNEFEYWKNNPDIVEDRLMEHAHAFYGYSIIPSQIESILEIGAGPFTQIQYLITPFRHINSITILEPNAISYMKLNNCKYKGGHLKGHSIEIISDSIESFMEKQRKLSTTNHKLYSIVVAINVVEHVQDAIEYFHAIYNLIEINGLVIFHERWFDHPRDGDCVLEDAERLHPIRITKFVIDIFLNQFETLFINYNKTLRQQKSVCKEQGVYFIGRKTK